MNQDGNPFLGPQPYREEDEERFLGRGEVTRLLADHILAYPCLTLYGPSGAGKSSLMEAGVIPLLRRSRECRVVHIKGWIRDEAPVERLARALVDQLALEQPPAELSPSERLMAALDLAEQQSSRPLLIYLDQLEQLFQQGREQARTEELLKSLRGLVRGSQGLHLVLALREDYLGLFRDRLRGRRELLEQGFRLGPLTVGQMVDVACELARRGEPAQAWDPAQLTELMLQVREPGQTPAPEAEVQTAFAQIVCRSLWEERTKGRAGQVEARTMLHQYLETTLEGLGPLKPYARDLLEKRLVARDGSRTLLMEQQALEELHGLSEAQAREVLARLEAQAVLRAEEHQGSRYFELGHDWLAARVLEQRQERERQERERQEREEQERREQETARKLQREHAARRRLALVAAGAVGVAVLMGLVMLWALRQQREAEEARGQAEKAQRAVEAAGDRERDHALMTGVREQVQRGKPDLAIHLLREVRRPEQVRGWEQLALDVLVNGAPRVTLRCHKAATAASFSPDGTRVVVGCADGTVWVWTADGQGAPRVLRGHEGYVWSASFSPDGQRIVTASSDNTARVWTADGQGAPRVLRGHEGYVLSASFSPDGQRIVTASRDKTARVWTADGQGAPRVLRGHEGDVNSASFSPDGQRIVTASDDTTARVWTADGQGAPRVLRGHEGPVFSASFSPDGQRIVTASRDTTARVWTADGQGAPRVLRGHEGPVLSASFSPDGQRIVTASSDNTAGVWTADGQGAPRVLRGHEGYVLSASFSPDGQRIVTASRDTTARVWTADGQGAPRVLRGHEGYVLSASFSPDGQRIVTASDDTTARVWTADGQGAPRVLRGHEGTVRSASFSPDGQRIVTASDDTTARVWTADGQGAPRVLRGHEGYVLSASFSPDGQRIVTASSGQHGPGVDGRWPGSASGAARP